MRLCRPVSVLHGLVFCAVDSGDLAGDPLFYYPTSVRLGDQAVGLRFRCPAESTALGFQALVARHGASRFSNPAHALSTTSTGLSLFLLSMTR